MCFHSKQSKTAQEVEHRYKAKVENKVNFLESEHINAFSFPKTPVITNRTRNSIENLSWGLIPQWAKNQEIRKYTLNAKIETINEKPSFKEVVNNRCLIISDGFYEWKWMDTKGKNKQKFLIELKGSKLFSFGGVYSEWISKTTGEKIKSYSMVTTEAKGIMREVHNSKMRMPVILTEDNEENWLNGNSFNNFKDLSPLIIAKPLNQNGMSKLF